MPRAISAGSLAILANKTGLEPVNIVEVRWAIGAQPHYYADRRTSYVEGKLISIANLEAVLNIDKSSTSTSVGITLDDTDSTIKTIFNNTDIHGRPVKIYQWFTDIPFADKFIVFEGVIASPIVWSEPERILRFDVMTKVEDREVGFSAEEGDFTNLPENIIGKAWPIVFGTVLNMPTLRVDDLPTGTTKVDIGIPDHSVGKQIDYINCQAGMQTAKANCLSARAAEMKLEATLAGAKELYEEGESLQRQATDMHMQVAQEMYSDRDRLVTIKADQDQYDISIIPIINGELFHQGDEIELDINGARYIGYFSGSDFHVRARRPPEEDVSRKPGTQDVAPTDHEFIIGTTQEEADKRYSDMIFGRQTVRGASGSQPRVFGGEKCEPPWFYAWCDKPTLDKQKEGKFFFAPAGTTVKVSAVYPVRYILSIIENTEVLYLSSKRTVNGLKVIDMIPASYYEVQIVDFGAVKAVIAVFSQPLSTITDIDWEDEVYATLRSSIGPNPVDILTYLIETYTDYDIDATSFAYVRTKLIPYPANFALKDRPNVIDLLKDIAWQSRCAIWISGDKFYIKYLPEDAATVETITETNVESRTMEVSTTETEDLITKMIATWQKDLSKDDPNKVILRYNTNKYGIKEETIDFYIFNHEELVVKSATFWMIRRSNVWKRLKIKTFIDKLKIETMDSVTLNFSRNYIADIPVNGLVEGSSFNSDDLSIDLDIWLPVRLGEMLPYIFAYPADIDISYIWPTEQDIAGRFAGDNPLDESGGDLGGRVNTRVTHHPSRHNRASPSDRADRPLGPLPIVTTVAAGFQPTITTAATGATINPATTRTQTNRPSYDYRYRNHPVQQQRPRQESTTATFPGFVRSKVSAKIYKCDLYPFGIDKEGEANIQCEQLQLDDTDTIPAGTAVIVTRLKFYVGDILTIKHYIQVPIFLES